MSFFKGKSYKKKLTDLQEKYTELESAITPEIKNAVDINLEIAKLTGQKANLISELHTLDAEIANKKMQLSDVIVALNIKEEIKKLGFEQSNLLKKLSEIDHEIASKRGQIIDLDEKILLQEYGIYEPIYEFALLEEYSNELRKIRDVQKSLIKNGRAVTGATDWTVNGSKSQGTKMVKDMQKLLLRAFNSECDELVDKVKVNNYKKFLERMQKSYDAISKLGTIMSVSITPNYLQSKKQELALSLDYAQKKQAEKEEQQEIRARMREEAKLQKEIEEQLKKLKKEEAHYSKALDDINNQIKNATGDELTSLLNKKETLESNMSEINKSLEDVDYRKANMRAGYVYIISNIGSFGENIYKIGMTRRLEPMDRVDELGDASVPFNFDVHAMIFSDDAPSLESALHKAFELKKVNMVNHRREFFEVTLAEIQKVVQSNFDKTVEFTLLAQAEQYRETLEIKKKMEMQLL